MSRISHADARRLGIEVPPRPTGRRDRMNKAERWYRDHILEPAALRGEILCHHFEAVKLRLADRTWYTPDFLVVLPDNSIVFHEVKGFWRDDARVKVKVAAETFPRFSFKAVQVRGSRGGYRIEKEEWF